METTTSDCPFKSADEIDFMDPVVQEHWFDAYDIIREESPAYLMPQIGMLEHLLKCLELRVAGKLGEREKGFSRISAYIDAQASQSKGERSMSRAMLAAAAEDPTLLDPDRAIWDEWFCAAQEEGSLAALMLLALEGLRFAEMLNLKALENDERHRLYAQMTELVFEIAPQD